MSDLATQRRSAAWRMLDAVKRANAPLPPESSVPFRVVTTLAVVSGLLACESVGELSLPVALAGSTAVAVGMLFSHLTRRRPWPLVKVVLAIVVVSVFVVFVHHALGQAEAGNLASVEGPLAVLFLWIQVTHAFDVPARRDLLFSIVASAAFVAVASAQAIQTSFLVIVAVWLVLCVVALSLSWQSMTGAAGRFPFGTVALCSGVAATVATLLIVVLPAPHPSQLITLPNSITSRLALPDQGGLVGGRSGTQPAKPASPSGELGVGGFEGFAGSLDTALRGTLGDEVVMRVRADRPGYLEALSYEEWSGTSWLNPSDPRALEVVTGGSPFIVDFGHSLSEPGGSASTTGTFTGAAPLSAIGPTDVETVYVAQPLANVLVASPDPLQVWLAAPELYLDLDDGSIRSPLALTPGTVYTVVSSSTQRSPAVLAADHQPIADFELADPAGLQLPHAYPAVKALADEITARAPTVYGKIEALEQWMTTHVHYSTDIPPLLPGQDAVNQFLFHGRIGYCEQISTALAVMLRTIGIPAREVTGYVPGSYNPLTDLWQIEAKDAHAWVKVWFPGYGWQSFDPTANVPLTNPSPGSLIASELARLARRLPLLPIGIALVAVLALALATRRWLRRPRTWAERVARSLERAGSSWGVERSATETLGEFAERLRAVTTAGHPDDPARPGGRPPPPASAPTELAASGPSVSTATVIGVSVAVLERAAYGGEEPDIATRRDVQRAARHLRRHRSPLRRRSRSGRRAD